MIVAAPAYATASILRDYDTEIARLCGEIPYASAGTIALAFRREDVGHPLNGSGFVVPRVEANGILAASWLSSKWPQRAPDGRVLLRAFVGGARDPNVLEQTDAQLVTRAIAALTPVLGIRAQPLLSRVYRFERANAQHEVGHLARIAAIDRALARHPGLFLTGSGLRGVGIPDCITDARATAQQVTEWLTARRATLGSRAPFRPVALALAFACALLAHPAAQQPVEIGKLLAQIKSADTSLLAVSEEDGRFLRTLVTASNAKAALEIGGAYGYSAIWIGLGLRETGGHLTSIEYDAARAKVETENIRKAGLADIVTVVPGDAFTEIPKVTGGFDFVFLDAWKRDYKRFFDMVFPRLLPHGLFLAHNVVNKQSEMRDFLAAIQNSPQAFSSIVTPSGEGMSVTVKVK